MEFLQTRHAGARISLFEERERSDPFISAAEENAEERIDTLPVLGQKHVYAGDAALMGAVFLCRALLLDADGSQGREEHPYHEQAASGGDQSRRIPSGLRARRELHQADDEHHRSQQQRADDDVQRIHLE